MATSKTGIEKVIILPPAKFLFGINSNPKLKLRSASFLMRILPHVTTR